MESMEDMVVASFSDPEDAVQSVKDLLDAEVSNEQIGLLARDGESGETFKVLSTIRSEINQNVGESIAKRAAPGVGGVLWGIGISIGALPVLGPVIGGGLLATTIASGMLCGGIEGMLIPLGLSAEETEFISNEVCDGKTTLVVKDVEALSSLREKLRRNNAILGPSRQGSGQVCLPKDSAIDDCEGNTCSA